MMAGLVAGAALPESRRGRALFLGAGLLLIMAGWIVVKAVQGQGRAVEPGSGTPSPPPYADWPPWTWPKAPGAGTQTWLREPWGGTGPVPDYLSGAMSGGQ